MGQDIAYNLRLPPRQCRTIFREMAKAEFRRGPLTSRRIRNLIAYAARLGIDRHDSLALIEEAGRDLGLSPQGDPPPPPGEAAGTSVSPRLWIALSMALIGAAAYHALFGA